MSFAHCGWENVACSKRPRAADAKSQERRLDMARLGVGRRRPRPGHARSVRNADRPSLRHVMAPSMTIGPPHARRAVQWAMEDRDGASPAREAEAWMASLRADGPAHDEAIGRLYELLLRAARFELSRRRAAMSYVRGEELDDLATQAADDALMAVLSKLDTYRGASRFTTWAYKFALLEAGVKLRRRAWQGREVVLDAESWEPFADQRESPQVQLE